jgi:hypothetical protein
LVKRRGWPDRLVIALEQSLFGGVDRASYAAEADVSPQTASNDLRRLLDAGFVVQRGKAALRGTSPPTPRARISSGAPGNVLRKGEPRTPQDPSKACPELGRTRRNSGELGSAKVLQTG